MLVETKINHMPTVMFTLHLNEKELNIIRHSLSFLPPDEHNKLGIDRQKISDMCLDINLAFIEASKHL